MTEETLFQKIIRREVPAEIVYEDENMLVFLDASPVSPGHALVIPKKPFVDIHEIPEERLQQLIVVVKKMATAIKKAVNADGINLEMNNGEEAGQKVFHAHIHVIPRFKDDNVRGHWKTKPYKEGVSHEVAEKIKKFL